MFQSTVMNLTSILEQLHTDLELRYFKDWVQSMNVTRKMCGNNYIVYGES